MIYNNTNLELNMDDDSLGHEQYLSLKNHLLEKDN